MKQILKRVSSVCAAVVCAVSLTVSGAVTAAADSEIDETVKTQLAETAEGLTEVIIPLSDEDITKYMESADDFTVQAITSWNSSKEEVGELKEIGKSEIEFEDDQYAVTVPVDFEKTDADFVYIFNGEGMPMSMAVEVKYPMSVTLQRAGLNTLMGIGTVFIMLVFLSFIISLFKFIPGMLDGKKKEAPVPVSPAPVPVQAPAVEEEVDDTELIAVIAAAIAASEGTSTDGFVVRSIRKINRKKW